MNFKEMQLIWDKQGEPLLTLDRKAMEKQVGLEKRVALFELGRLELAFILGLVGLGVAVSVESILQRGEYFQFVGAAVDFTIATWIYLSRRRRRETFKRIGDGLLGEIDKAILGVRTSMKLVQQFFVFFLVAMPLGLFVRVVFVYQTTEGSEVKIVLAALLLPILWLFIRRERKTKFEPKIEDLALLKARLENG